MDAQHTISQHDERLSSLAHHYRKCLFKCVQPTCLDGNSGQSQCPGSLCHRRQPDPIVRKVGIEHNGQTPRGSVAFPSECQTAYPKSRCPYPRRAQAAEAGIARRTLTRAKADAGVETKRSGGTGASGHWEWSPPDLPKDATPEWPP
jgi:hypothetical protein